MRISRFQGHAGLGSNMVPICQAIKQDFPEYTPDCSVLQNACVSSPDPAGCAYEQVKQLLTKQASDAILQNPDVQKLLNFPPGQIVAACIESGDAAGCIQQQTEQWLKQTAINEGIEYASPVAPEVVKAAAACVSAGGSPMDCAKQIAASGLMVAADQAGIPPEVTRAVAQCVADGITDSECIERLAMIAAGEGGRAIGIPPEALYAVSRCAHDKNVSACAEAGFVGAATVACGAAAAAFTGGLGAPLCGFIAGPAGRLAYQAAAAVVGAAWDFAKDPLHPFETGGMLLTGNCFDWQAYWNKIQSGWFEPATLTIAADASNRLEQMQRAQGVYTLPRYEAEEVRQELLAPGGLYWQYGGLSWNWRPNTGDYACNPSDEQSAEHTTEFQNRMTGLWLEPYTKACQAWLQQKSQEIALSASMAHQAAMQVAAAQAEGVQKRLAAAKTVAIAAAHKQRTAEWLAANDAARIAWGAKVAKQKADWEAERVRLKAQWQTEETAIQNKAVALKNAKISAAQQRGVAVKLGEAQAGYQQAEKIALAGLAVGALLVATAIVLESRS